MKGNASRHTRERKYQERMPWLKSFKSPHAELTIEANIVEG